MQDHISEFIDFMAAQGIAPADRSEIVADDEIHRYRLEGDKPRVQNGSYRLAVDDDFSFGWAQSFREGVTYSWHTKTKRKWTAEEKAEHKRKAAAAKAEAEAKRKAASEASQIAAKELWDGASKTGDSPYLAKKGIALRGVRFQGETLVVPMWRDGVLASVQRVLPDGTKLFMKSSDHVGAYFSIKGDLGTIAICEGVSTGASVHEATGWSVICAFNAGNMKSVAVSIRAKYPDARIVFAADNDHTVTKPNGDPYNPGLDKAQQAAVAIGGAQVISPQTEDGITDWNDVHASKGIDAVKDGLTSVPVPAPAQPEPDDTWEPDYDLPDDDAVVDDEPDADPIRPLGHNRGSYYFFPRATGQIMEFSATALGRAQNLFQLAPRAYWERMYAPEDSMSKIADYASGDLIRLCQDKGIFSLENARGVGVWNDNGSLLVNCGNVIVGEGVRCHPSAYNGDYVYEAGQRVINMDVEPLSVSEASRFRGICKSLTWKKPQYGDLLAGWVVVSAVGGALDWRPHIFVTGRKGSGKSTVMDKIVRDGLKGMVVKRDGGTTEPGIRKALGASSRPFMMDEAESESSSRRSQMQMIFEYFRNASSGAVVENAYATYVARSAACFGAINPRIEQGADADRWSMLELYPNNAPDSEASYKRLLSEIADVINDEFPNRLLARTVANLDVLLDNIDVFVSVFSKKLGSKRAGDQIGTLVAGSYSLTSNSRVTYEFVEKWVNGQDWQWHELGNGMSDAEALVSHIMASRIRYDQDGMGRESSVGELIQRATGSDDVGRDAAIRGLGGVGIRIEDGRLMISNSAPPLKAILRETPWGMWKRTLGDYDGADNCNGATVYFGPGLRTRATSIPLMDAIGLDVTGGSGEFDMEGF